jgi:hypothetical protein
MKTVMVTCLLVLMTRTCCSTAVASQPAATDVASDTEPVVDTFKNRPVRDDSRYIMFSLVALTCIFQN